MGDSEHSPIIAGPDQPLREETLLIMCALMACGVNNASNSVYTSYVTGEAIFAVFPSGRSSAARLVRIKKIKCSEEYINKSNGLSAIAASLKYRSTNKIPLKKEQLCFQLISVLPNGAHYSKPKLQLISTEPY